MKRNKILVFIVIFFISILPGFSQVFNMNNSTEYTCSGVFYDSGGENNDYGSNENFTMIFIPETSGSVLKFTFSEFDLESKP